MIKSFFVLCMLLITHVPSFAETCDGDIYEEDSNFTYYQKGRLERGGLWVEDFYIRLVGEADWQRCHWNGGNDDDIYWICGNMALSQVNKYFGNPFNGGGLPTTGYILSRDRKGYFLFHKRAKVHERDSACKIYANYPVPRGESTFPRAAVTPYESVYRYKIKNSEKGIELKLVSTYVTPVVKIQFR